MTAHLASDTVGMNVRIMRKTRKWSVAELAGRLAEMGCETITASVIENIEHGRKRDGVRTRDVTVDELIAIADALMVSPSMLLPEMISEPVRYENVDGEDRDVIMDVILNNLEVMKQYINQRRAVRASVIVNPQFPVPVGDGKVVKFEIP